MAIVIDASVALAWFFPDEESHDADRILDIVERDGAIVPAIWALEVINGLLAAERRGRISRSEATRALELASRLELSTVPTDIEEAMGDVYALAREHGLSAYDAAYLQLAMREGLALATLDGRLRTAANEAGVALAI
jgi:predicted nucleic acid-binding protein